MFTIQNNFCFVIFKKSTMCTKKKNSCLAKQIGCDFAKEQLEPHLLIFVLFASNLLYFHKSREKKK